MSTSLLLLLHGVGAGPPTLTPLLPGLSIEVELNGVGGGWTAVTDDVIRGEVFIQYGIWSRGPTALVAGTGSCRFTLNNSQLNSAGVLGYYSRLHASRRAGWDLNIRIWVKLTDPATSIQYTWFFGKISWINPAPGIHGSRRVDVMAVDWIDDAARWNLTADIPPQVGKTGGELVQAVLAAMPSNPVGTVIENSTDVYPYALDVGRVGQSPAHSEFSRIAQSGLHRIYMKRSGELRFEARHTRLLNTSVAWALTDSGLPADGGLDAPAARDDIINTVRMTSHPRSVDPAPTSTVYDQANPIALGPGEVKTILGSFRDEVTGDTIGAVDVLYPDAGAGDYSANDLETGTGTDRTPSLTIVATIGSMGVKFTLTNTFGATIWVTHLRLRGRRVLDWKEEQSESTDPTSKALYGEHAISIDMPYQGRADVAQGAADFVRLQRQALVAQVPRLKVLGNRPAHLTQILSREISDRISVTESLTGVNSEFFIDGIALKVGPIIAEVTYNVSPAQDPYNGNYFVMDVDALDGVKVLAPF